MCHGFVPIERTDGSGNEEGAPDILYTLGAESAGTPANTDGELGSDESRE